MTTKIIMKKNSINDLNKEIVSNLIGETFGNLTEISNRLNISRKLLVHYIESDKSLQEDFIHSKFSIKDLAEKVLVDSMMGFNTKDALLSAVKIIEKFNTKYEETSIDKILIGEDKKENSNLEKLQNLLKTKEKS